MNKDEHVIHVNSHLYIVSTYHTHHLYSIFLLGILISATL